MKTIEELERENARLQKRASVLMRGLNSKNEAIRIVEAENARLMQVMNAQNILTCVYCGQAYPPGTPTHGSPVLTEHIKVCPKHPMRALEQENTRLEERLAAAGSILAEWGCDCDPGPGGVCCDRETTCEEAGHEPCLAHLIERAIHPKGSVPVKTASADLAVQRLFSDIADRRGLKWEWKKIDPDVQEEIRAAWKKIIVEATRGAECQAPRPMPMPVPLPVGPDKDRKREKKTENGPLIEAVRQVLESIVKYVSDGDGSWTAIRDPAIEKLREAAPEVDPQRRTQR